MPAQIPDQATGLGDAELVARSGVTVHGPRERAPASGGGAWWVLGLCVAAVIASVVQILLRQPLDGRFLLTLCFLVCGAGAFVDAATRRIPNRLTYPAIVLGLLLNVVLPPLANAAGWETFSVWVGSTGARDGLLGFGLCSAIGIISFVARGLGGGDVKLLASVGAMLGLEAVVAVLFNTLLVAATIGIVNWTANGTLMLRTQILANNLLSRLLVRGRTTVEYPFKPTEAPFGVALLIGLTLAQFVALHRELLEVAW